MINQKTIEKLQFDSIAKEVRSYAIGEYSKEKMLDIELDSNVKTVQVKQQETAESRAILDSGQHVPFMGLTHIQALLNQVSRGLLLQPNELVEVADFLRSNRKMQTFFEKNRHQTPLLYQYSKYLSDFHEIEDSIDQKINHLNIVDEASSVLRRIRSQLNEKEQEIETKLLKFIRHPQNKQKIQDALIVNKGGSYTVPIKASYKNAVAGNLVDQSSKGSTVYIEPSAVSKLNEQIAVLKAEEQAEEYQILAELTGYVSEQEASIKEAIEQMTLFDLIFARAKYSRSIDGVTPKVNKEERIKIIQGKHPLLLGKAVPLNFSLGMEYRGLVITGANAGGKTVGLKTVGLLTVMTMFGLQIPAEIGTEIAVFEQLFVDIGDQQAIENALSTFSGHMKSIAEMMNHVGRHTLVLLDEIGSGTEPNEGAGLAIAILENMYQKGSLLVATTHYGEIKRFAEEHDDFIPAAMAFDHETLTPKYVLQVGRVGDSQALSIARKMNMPAPLIRQADQYIQEKMYPRDKKTFNPIIPKEKGNRTLTEKARFRKGDRVLLTATQEIGLVYADKGLATIQVFVEDEIREVLRKRLKLEVSAESLYPEGYDLDGLFVDFQIRKKERDLERGSKKAKKELAKEASKRKSNKNTE